MVKEGTLEYLGYTEGTETNQSHLVHEQISPKEVLVDPQPDISR